MQASQPERAQDPADAPYDDDYAEPRVSFVHEQPRASRTGVMLMLTVVSLLMAGLALASRSVQAPLAAPSLTREQAPAALLVTSRPVRTAR